jgi:hypothetical protein
MVGYHDDFEAFRCYHPPTHKILITRDNKFDGNFFWHSFIDLSSKPLISLEQISDQSIAIMTIDPPTSYAFLHFFFKFLNQLFLWIGFQETFALVSKWSTICCLVSMVVQHGWEILHMDVKYAFLNG